MDSLDDFREETPKAARNLADGPRESWTRRRMTSSEARKGRHVIDGGNSITIDYRARRVSAKGIHYCDVGTSRRFWGLDRGYWPDYSARR